MSLILTQQAIIAAQSLGGLLLAITKAAGTPYIAQYRVKGKSLFEQELFSPAPSQVYSAGAFSHSGEFFAAVKQSSPAFNIYKRTGKKYDLLSGALPAVALGQNTSCVSWNADNTHLAIAHYGSPFLRIFSRNGNTFTQLAAPATLPNGNGASCTYSPDGVYLAVGHAGSTYMSIYKRSGTTYTKLANPSSMPPRWPNRPAWSLDGIYLACPYDQSPYLTIYKRSGDAFTKLANPATLPSNAGICAAFSPDGAHLIIGVSNITLQPIVYKRSGDAFAALPTALSNAPTAAMRIAYSPDGKLLALIGYSGGSYGLYLYARNGDAYSLISTVAMTSSNDISFAEMR